MKVRLCCSPHLFKNNKKTENKLRKRSQRGGSLWEASRGQSLKKKVIRVKWCRDIKDKNRNYGDLGNQQWLLECLWKE